VSSLRVVHIDSGTTWRGGQRQALLLAVGLRRLGHEPFLIASPESPLATRARGEGLAVATIRMRADWDIRAAKKIRARIRAWRADVVHAHDARSHALAMFALLGTSSAPLIVTRRVPFTPRSARLKYGERVARFIAISQAVKDAMVNGGIDPNRIDVVFSGIELPTGGVPRRDWRDELGWPGNSVLAGVVGAMTAEKGMDSVTTMAGHLSEGVARRLRFVFMGGPVEGDHPVGRVGGHSAGFVHDIHPAMAGVDFLIHPSRAEGLGTAVLDAMALGVPPIAFAVGGIPEVIIDGESGLLVAPGDHAALGAAVESLVVDPGLRDRLAQGAMERAQSFGADRMTKGTEAVYNRVLGGWR
jgi:glycosyltransferase involved in cell wall biosynthesis